MFLVYTVIESKNINIGGNVNVEEKKQEEESVMIRPPLWHTTEIHTPGPETAAAKEAVITLQSLQHEMNQIAIPAEKKRYIGERLFPQIQQYNPRRAAKITGMLLEMDNNLLLSLIVNKQLLVAKINEAMQVLYQDTHPNLRQHHH